MRTRLSDFYDIYDKPARTFHWITVMLLVAQYAIAWTMPDVHRDTKPVGLIAWHLSLGMLIVLVVLTRLLWRATHAAPPHAPGVPAALARIAGITHGALYALLIVVPLMGWANASSRGWSVHLAGVLPMPPLSPTGSAIGHAMGDWHADLAWVLIALIAMHVGAALFHQFVLGDGTLGRMLPRRRAR
jgi:cytochrome b561